MLRSCWFAIGLILACLTLQVILGQEQSHGDQVREHLKEMKADIQVNPEDEEYYYFSLHDLNGDGFIDGLELREIVNDAHNKDIPLDKMESYVGDALFAQDVDNDGRLNFNEFHGKV